MLSGSVSPSCGATSISNTTATFLSLPSALVAVNSITLLAVVILSTLVSSILSMAIVVSSSAFGGI